MSTAISNSSPIPKQSEPSLFTAKIHQVWEFSAQALRRLIRIIKDLIERFFASFRSSPKEKLPPLPPAKKLQPEPPTPSPVILQAPMAVPPPQTPSPPAPQTNVEQVGIFTVLSNYFGLTLKP
jgi:hypothetical protein